MGNQLSGYGLFYCLDLELKKKRKYRTEVLSVTSGLITDSCMKQIIVVLIKEGSIRYVRVKEKIIVVLVKEGSIRYVRVKEKIIVVLVKEGSIRYVRVKKKIIVPKLVL